MSGCSNFDLKAYALGEAEEPARRLVEDHARSCAACRAELDRLALTRAALVSLPEEEMPRRIAFVSDKVFEPGWWHRFWHAPARLGFASAVLLAAAIVSHGFLAARPQAPAPVAAVDTAAIEQRIRQEVARAVAESEQRQAQRIAQAVSETEKRLTFDHRAEMLAVESNFELLRKQMSRMYVASSQLGGAQ